MTYDHLPNDSLNYCLFSDHGFMQFFGDDFLRVLLLRFIFCYVVLRLHRAFNVSISSSRVNETILCLPCKPFALFTNFPQRGSPCIVCKIKKKLNVCVSCTNYFLSIHNLRCSVQLIKIAKGEKKSLKQTTLNPRCRFALPQIYCDVTVFVSPVHGLGRFKNEQTTIILL